MKLDAATRRLLALALAEDLGAGDLTTRTFLPGRRVRARVVAKAAGVFCGGPVAAAVFARVAPGARVRAVAREGARIRPGQTLLALDGPTSLLSGERVALNFLQRLSGVATLTRRFVDAARGTGVAVYDTRKTTPGWRGLEKYAVRCGGGRNHRMGLFDAVMLKDNHLKVLQGQGGEWIQGLAERIAEFRRRRPGIAVEVEAQSRAEARRVLALRPDVILLDNMSLPAMQRAIALIRTPPLPQPSPHWGEGRERGRRILIEISGGVRLENIRALARLRPDRISVGRLTHSAPALDMSLEIDG